MGSPSLSPYLLKVPSPLLKRCAALPLRTERFSSSFIICRTLSLIICRCCATFAALRGAFASSASRHCSLFVGHCCSLFAVATQRFKPSQRFSSSSIICRTLLFIVCRCCATFEAFATFLVIVHRLFFSGHGCSLFVVASQRLKPSQRFSSSFIAIVHYLLRSCSTYDRT